MKKLCLQLLILLICSFQASFAQLYVSPSGNDGNKGDLNHPFASIIRARDEVRHLKKIGGLPISGTTIFLRQGNYFLSSGVNFNPEDSGNPGSPVIYRAYPGERVNLIGGKQIDPKLWRPLSSDARKRVSRKVNVSQLFELDVAALQLRYADRFAPFKQFTTDWFILDLFANNIRQPISQWPNPDENIRQKNDPGWTTCNGSKNAAAFYFGSGGRPVDRDTANEVDADGTHRAERWASALKEGHEIWLKGLWRTAWEPITTLVKSIDLNDHSIELAEVPPGGMGSKYSPLGNQQPLWRVGSGREDWLAINLLEEIDEPGEWALDVKDHKIYYYPPAPLEELNIMIADMKEPLINIERTAYLQIIGLNICGGLSDGVNIQGGRHIKIAGCHIINSGSSAINMTAGEADTIQSNDVITPGGWGIRLKDLGNRAKLLASNVLVTNNHVHHVGQLAFKEALSLENCVGVTVSHNLLHDIPKGAVRTDGVNNCLFEFNEIHNNALQEGDTGTFYSYGGWANYGNIYRYNFSHHTNRSNGFYCDDGDSGDWFYKNIEQGLISGVKFGGGHDNLADSNLIVQSKDQTVDDRGKDRNYRLGTKYETNLTRFNLDKEPWKSFGEQLTEQHKLSTHLWRDILDPSWHPEYPNGCRMRDNVAVASGKFTKPVNGKVEIEGNVELLSVKDAMFFDYAKMDLRSKNPLILKKFPELNDIFPKIGLERDLYRSYLPTRAETGGLINRRKDGDPGNEDQFTDKIKPNGVGIK